MDYSLLPKTEAVPEAASMIETFRAIGYNLETAVADIIDNSISAKEPRMSILTEYGMEVTRSLLSRMMGVE